jgi:hypothetical protein
MEPVKVVRTIAKTIVWLDSDFIDEDIKELFRNKGAYLSNEPLIAQQIKLMRQLLENR